MTNPHHPEVPKIKVSGFFVDGIPMKIGAGRMVDDSDPEMPVVVRTWDAPDDSEAEQA